MTNHPRRAHGDDGQPGAEPEIPAAEVTPGTDVPAPPAHTANGHPGRVPPGLQPNAAKIIGETAGQAIGQVLSQQLPQILANAFYQVLSQVLVQVAPGPCGPCSARRAAWLGRHAAVLAQAEALLQAAHAAQAALPPDQQAPINPRDFLPEQLRPSADPASPNPEAMPDIRQGEVLISGTWYCQADMPTPVEAAESAAPRKPLLIAQGALSSALIAEAMTAPMPG